LRVKGEPGRNSAPKARICQSANGSGTSHGRAPIRSVLLKCVGAITLDHELRSPPNIDLGYQSARLMNCDLPLAKRLKSAILPPGQNVDSGEDNHETSNSVCWHGHGGRSFYRMRASTAVKRYGDVWHTYYAWAGPTQHDEQRGHAQTQSQLLARSSCHHAA